MFAASEKRRNEIGAELDTFRQQQKQRRANLAKGTAASAAKRAAAKVERAGSVA